MFVDYGEGDEVVFVEECGDFVVAGFFLRGDQRLLSQGKERRFGLGEDYFHQGNGSDKSAVGIDEIDGDDGFDAAFELAHYADGVLHRGGDGEGEEFGGHAAGGGFFAVFEEFDDLLAGLGLHLDEDLFGVILGEVGEEVGGGVGIHLLDDVGGAFGVEGFDDRLLDAGLNFFESLGGDFFVEGAEDGFALVGSEVFDDVGDVSRMEGGQAFVSDLELDAARGIGFDQVDKTPGDGAWGNSIEQELESAAGCEAAVGGAAV